MQFGSGWWYLDQKDGIEWQMDALSNTGLLSQLRRHADRLAVVHVLSAARILPPRALQLLGREMDRGELPADERVVGSMVKDICFGNARKYLRLAF